MQTRSAAVEAAAPTTGAKAARPRVRRGRRAARGPGRRRHGRRRPAGLSLVEVLFATLLLSLGALSLLTLGRGETVNARHLRDRCRARDLAANLVEVLTPLGGGFLERGAPRGPGGYVFLDPQREAWFPPLGCLSTLGDWLARRGAEIEVRWRPGAAEPARHLDRKARMGLLTCTILWEEDGRERSYTARRIILR